MKSLKIKKLKNITKPEPEWIDLLIKQAGLDKKSVYISVQTPTRTIPAMYVDGKYYPERIESTGKFICTIKGNKK